VLAGPGPADAVAWRLVLPPPRHERLRDYRVAAWLDDPAAPVDASVAAVLEQVAAAVEGAGARVDRAARPELDFAAAAALGRNLITAATAPAAGDESFARLCALADELRASSAEAPPASPAQLEALEAFTQRHRAWLRNDAARSRVRRAWADFFTRYDVLLCPVTLLPPIPHQQEGSFAERVVTVNGQLRPYPTLIDWTSLIGSAYLPVTVPPVGRTPDGLPVGVQVVAPYLEDRSALVVAREIAELGDGYVPPPLALAPDR
jgi:amidase